MKHYFIIISCLLICLNPKAQINALEFGQCYKIGITKNGVYKIDANFLSKKGIDISKINPKNIHIIGNGAGMLPQANKADRSKSLIENSIIVQGEADNKLDKSDYILFYGQGPHKIEFDIEKQSISHKTHVYSDSAYYFLVINDKPGLRIENQIDEINKQSTIIDTYDDYLYHEKDSVNINTKKNSETGKSGREFWGEEFGGVQSLDRSFNLNVNNIVPNSTIKLQTVLIGATKNESSNFKVFLDDIQVQDIDIESVYDYEYAAKGIYKSQEKKLKTNNAKLQKLEIKLRKSTENYPNGFLDFFALNLKRTLIYEDKPIAFRSFESLKTNYTSFTIKSSEPKLIIWDITNPLNPKNQQFRNDASKIFTVNTIDKLKEFLAFTEKDIQPISQLNKINNQNIRQYQSPELIIITKKKYKAAAQKLAEHRIKNSNISTEIIDIDEIYNEFSSGMVDVTAIRDFTKYMYDQPSKRLKYLLILADAASDIRNKGADSDLKRSLPDLIPTYQSRESLDIVKSFCSEDYFGFLEENEGEWLETESDRDNHTLDIGVGRIPVKSVEDAEGMVQKIIYYETKAKTIGKWRTKVTLTADDGDFNLHQLDIEDLTKIIQKKGNSFSTDKIYVDASPRLSGNFLGKLSPVTSNKIYNTFKKGALIFNYTGHGGVKNLSDEKILDRDEIIDWQNLENLPLMVTATCQFGRYDDPLEVCGGEKALLNPEGGAIALLTTTRPVYSSSNKKINEAFYNTVFEPINGENPRLGDVFRLTKNKSFDSIFNRNFTLLGDPSMRLTYPDHKIILNKINGKPITEKKDTLKALETVIFEGELRDFKNNTLLQDFNGQIFFTAFDKETSLKTLGNNANIPMKYSIYQDKIFEGIMSVTNGRFKISLTIPKDIQYNYGFGRIEMYAHNSEKNIDASGVFNNFVIGGSKESIASNNTPPTITAYLNNKEFKNGNKTTKNPLLIAKLKATNGLNINRSAIGHEILAVIDGKTNIVLNEYINSILDNTQEFDLKYQLNNLSIGKHKLSLTIWDIYNNTATTTLEFEVTENNLQKLNTVANYPNPVNSNTKIEIDHNFVGENIETNVTILNVNGKIIGDFENTFKEAESPLIINIPQKFKFIDLPKGIYPYLVKVKSEKTNKTALGSSKLIVID
jgi:Peptidase family C25